MEQIALIMNNTLSRLQVYVPQTYAEFTFCIKSQGHVSDENFLYYCMHLASKISSYTVSEIYKTKRLSFIYR